MAGGPGRRTARAQRIVPGRDEGDARPRQVRLRTGETHSSERSIPVGAIGPDTRARHPGMVRAKFLAAGGPEQTADIAANLPDASAAEVRQMLSLALR